MAISAPRRRAGAYLVSTVFALAYMGHVGEICSSFSECPSRLSAVIAMGVLTALVTLALTVLAIMEQLPQMAEAGAATFAAVLNTCGLAVASSAKTTTSFDTDIFFCAIAEIAIVIGAYFAFVDDGFDVVPRAKAVDPPVVTPAAPFQQHIPASAMPPPSTAVPAPIPVPVPSTISSAV